MPRVAGVDPGTVSFDLCVLQDSAPVVQRTFASEALSTAPEPLLAALHAHGPYDLVYGPSGYGLPLIARADVGERELAEMVLVRPDEVGGDVGLGGLRGLLRALAASDLPVVFGPGVIQLPTVPTWRKHNRIDLGTADKLCSAACAIADQAARGRIEMADTSLILVELGGAFTAALAIDGGAVVDGVGGSSGPPGARAVGALDGELAYLLGPALSKATLFSGGAFWGSGGADPIERWADPQLAEGRTVLLEGVAKAVRALTVSVPAPRDIVMAGRLAAVDPFVAELSAALSDIAPTLVLRVPGGSSAALGAAMLADGLVGGHYAPLCDVLRLREACGGPLDHLRIVGADHIALG